MSSKAPRRRAASGNSSIQELSAEQRRELLRELLAKQRARPRRWPLSLAQQRLWILSQLESDNAAYNSSFSLHLRGDLVEPALDRSLNALVERHEILRTCFRAEQDEPMQMVVEPRRQSLAVEDLAELPAAERQAAACARIRAWIRRPFDLERGPLFRARLWHLDRRHHLLSMALHHIVYDGWSMGIIVRELAALYRGLVRGEPPALADLPIQYGEYAARQRRQLAGPVGDRQLDYWRRQLAGMPDLQLPVDHPRPPAQSYAGSRQSRVVPGQVAEALEALSRRQATTLFTTGLAAFGVLLSRYSDQQDFAVGTLIANRDQPELEGLIGFFVNTIVARLDLSREPSFRQLIGRARDVMLGAFDNKDLPFERIVDELAPERDLSRNPLFQALFLFQAGAPTERAAGLELQVMELDTKLARFDLEVYLRRQATGLRLLFNYRTDLFEAATIGRMSRHFQALLENAAAAPDLPISRIPLLPAGERHQLLVEWNDTGMAPARTDLIHELIAAQVRRTPDAVAVVSGDAGTQLTYAELDRRAGRLAACLTRHGIGTGRGDCLVGLCAERGAQMLIGVLGILKAGAAYVPLDPDLPAERLAFMARDSALAALLTQERLSLARPAVAALARACAGPVLRLEDEAGDERIAPWAPAGEAAGGDTVFGNRLAYVMFTSGSTGRPKGVPIPHRAVVSFLRSMRRRPGLSTGDVLLAITTLSFDISVLELFLPLTVGARLVIVPRDAVIDGRRLARRIAAERATVLQATPTGWSLLLESGWRGAAGLRMLSGGEALPPSRARRLHGRGAELWNLYGPTETTIWSSVERLHAGAEEVSLGRPIANTSLHVLDRRRRPVASGLPGQLYIGGVGLARGYLNRPRLTAASFGPDLWGPPGGRLYRTGDRVRLDARGRLGFLGRIDSQIKLRGHRIELGEIESVLRRARGVHDAVAVVREDRRDDPRLVAYVVAGPEVRRRELKSFLRKRLPAAMVPTAVMRLEALPLTPNRKVDRRALPPPEAADSAAGSSEPRTPVEAALAEIWASLLRVEQVGIHDSFFELGGHSLLAMRAISRVRDVFEVEVPLRELFVRPTVATLAAAVDRLRRDASPPPPPLVPVDREAELPLSFGQQRLWFLDQLEGGPAYHMPHAFRLQGSLDVAALGRGLGHVVERHEALRTRFPSAAGVPRQEIVPAAGGSSPVVDLSGLALPGRRREARRLASAEARRRFDLARGPLLRSLLLRLDRQDHVWLWTIHHIVADAWSVGLFLRELEVCYRAAVRGREPALQALPVQVADFAVWQRQWLAGEVLETQLAYWRRQLGGGARPLELPTDRPRPAVRTFAGARHRILLPEEAPGALRSLAGERGATLAMALLAVFKVLLHRASGRCDVAVGSPIANRNRSEVEGLIGLFANTLVLRTDLGGDPSFVELLRRERRVAVGAYDHQDLPFERLVEELVPRRDLGRNPLFEVLFVIQNMPAGLFALPGLTVDRWLITGGGGRRRRAATRFDLELYLGQTDRGLAGSLVYNVELFDATTIARLAGHLRTLLAGVVEDPEAPLSRLPLLSAAQKHQVVHGFNDGAARGRYVLDQQGEPVPLGFVGELALGAGGPAPAEAGRPGGYLERTGDLARLRPDGRVETLGRMEDLLASRDGVGDAPEEGPGWPEGGAELPETPLQEQIAELWCEVLGTERVGLHASFFDLGGHSLLATRLVAGIEQRFGVELPLRAVFEAPTVAGQELEITRRLAVGEDAEELARMIEEVEALSDQELQTSLLEAER